jgi:hypothetical protein
MCAFDVTLAVPPEDVGATVGITSRPFVKSRRAEGGQLPVIRENPKCNIAPDSGTYLHSRMYTV